MGAISVRTHLSNRMPTVANTVDKRSRELPIRVANYIVGLYKANIVVRTGRLRDSASATRTGERRATVRVIAPYAGIIEFGSAGKGGFRAGRFTLTRAIAEAEKVYDDEARGLFVGL